MGSRLIWTRLFTSNVFEDWSNRLNHCWTFYLLLLLAGVTGWWKHYATRISCWTPVEFTSGWVAFTNEYCWEATSIESVISTEDIGAYQKSLPSMFVFSGHPSTNEHVTYYQYIPIILAFQALLFKLPHVIWLLFHGYSGISSTKIYGIAASSPRSTWADHRTTTRVVASYINSWIKSNLLSCMPWRVLTIVAGIVKLLYVINSVTQLAVLDSFLMPGNGSNLGSHVIDALKETNGSYWLQSPRFPHSVYCEMNIRRLMNILSYSFQCTLPINQLHEQVYMFVWVWLLFVANVTICSFVFWIVKSVLPFLRTRYVKKFLSMSEGIDPNEVNGDDVGAFANYLGEDGIMVLKAISEFSSELMVRDVLADLWRMRKSGDQANMPIYRPLGSSPGQVLTPPPPTAPSGHLYPNPYVTPGADEKPEDIQMMPVTDPIGGKFQ